MEAVRRRIEIIENLHKKYTETMEPQLSILLGDITKHTPSVEQELQNEDNENTNSRRDILRSSVIVNNKTVTINAPVRGVNNGRVMNNHSGRPNIENRVPRTHQVNQNNSRQGNRQFKNSCTTSKKMRDFSMEPIGEKVVHKIPGIGPKAAEKLSSTNYVFARRILGKFLVSDKEEFVEFLQREGGVLKHNALKTWESLEAYKVNNV